MSDADLAPIWKELGKVQGAQDGHEKRLDQQHADIIGIRRDIEEVKIRLADGLKETRNEIRGDMLSFFAEQEKRLIEAFTSAQAKVERSVPVRDFIQERPYASIGISGVIVAVLNWFAPQLGIVPRP
jgi:ElaB/YqjD/DUF883 family membrane-anchored ribosome-binding protein